MLVSVIMSVYNESISDFLEALKSICNQTYKNMEIIIIVDNPKRNDIEEAISEMQDERIIVRKNKENLGLAASMNIAATLAGGEFLARMDADDIAYPNRIEQEINVLKDNTIDYVCTWFEYIDKDGITIPRKTRYYKNDIINDMIPYINCIHHPTVLIRKSVFDTIGGYRNFPCAQDYDLWLRLYENGYHVAIVEQILLSYRIRGTSVTAKSGPKQFYTIEYIRGLFKEREKTGTDSYSMENYQNYLLENGALDSVKAEQWKREKNNLSKCKLYYLILIFKSEARRKIFLNGLKIRFMKYYLTYFKF